MARGTSKSKPPHGDDVIVPTDEASTAFVRGLIKRGEAVRLASNAPLPPGATHEIIDETEAGVPILRRRRFALF